jgi:hypothetical protein
MRRPQDSEGSANHRERSAVLPEGGSRRSSRLEVEVDTRPSSRNWIRWVVIAVIVVAAAVVVYLALYSGGGGGGGGGGGY